MKKVPAKVLLAGKIVAGLLVAAAALNAIIPPDVEAEWTTTGSGTLRNLTGEPLNDLAMETYAIEPATVGGFRVGFERVTYHALFDNVSREEQFEWLSQTTPGGYGDAHYIRGRDTPPLRELFPAPPSRLGPHGQAGFSFHRTDIAFPPSVQVWANGHPLRVRQILRRTNP